LGIAGVLLPILLVIARVLSMPFNLTVTLVGPVVRIRSEFILLLLPLANTLAGLLTTIPLIPHPRIGIQDAFTMGGCALNLCVHGFPPTGEKP
jgi:hypothetical protein